MPRESGKAKRERAAKIYEALEKEYPEAETALNHENPFQLAVATILSAQCTDEQVNRATPELFRRFSDPSALAGASLEDVEKIVHSTGFFRSKAKNIVGMSRMLLEEHDGVLPRSIKELTELPGIGRKTANVILGNAFGIDEGVVVDTHVKRLAGRMGFTRETDPGKVEKDLMGIFPRERWTVLSHLLILHGRALCPARRPRCADCPVAGLCPSAGA